MTSCLLLGFEIVQIAFKLFYDFVSSPFDHSIQSNSLKLSKISNATWQQLHLVVTSFVESYPATRHTDSGEVSLCVSQLLVKYVSSSFYQHNGLLPQGMYILMQHTIGSLRLSFARVQPVDLTVLHQTLRKLS